MKRGAERQLTKDGHDDDDDDDIEEIQDPQGFQAADEATLAKRQIRTLPRRAMAASRPPSLNGLPLVPTPDVEKDEATPQPKFGGFVGFGAGASVSSPFTFTTQLPDVPASSPFAFDTGAKPVQSTPFSASPFIGVPKPAPSDPAASLSKPVTPPPVEETDVVVLKYFKSLRGLNVSFLSAISTAVEKDPFFDAANLVESYRNLRTTIKSEFDRSSQPSTTRVLAAVNPASIFGTKPPPEKTAQLLSVPKPTPEASSKFPSINEGGPNTVGFTFPPFVPPSSSAPAQLPFGLIPKPIEPAKLSSATPPQPSKSAFTFAAPSTSIATSNLPSAAGFSFNVSSGVEDTTSKTVPVSSSHETEGSSASSPPRPALTVPSLGSSSVVNVFATTKPASIFGTPDAASRPVSVFGGSTFGNSSTADSNKPSPFNPSSSTLAGIFEPAEKPASLFGNASQPKTSAFSFGKPGGSIGNPVGFGFGGSLSSAGDATTTRPSSSGFNPGMTSSKPIESLFSPPMTDRSSESTPQAEAEGGEEEAAKLLPSHTHDEEGEGEEDEETTHVIRCKIFRLFKSEDKNEWKDLGIGMLRLKKHKETNVRRVLMRNSNTGRILMNFRISGSLKSTLSKNTVSFVGYENSTPIPFNVRVKTEEQARDFKLALEQEISAVQEAE